MECGVDRKFSLNSWDNKFIRNGVPPGETIAEHDARTKKIEDCMKSKGYVLLDFSECGPRKNRAVCVISAGSIKSGPRTGLTTTPLMVWIMSPSPAQVIVWRKMEASLPYHYQRQRVQTPESA
jgi:hypothetical protein